MPDRQGHGNRGAAATRRTDPAGPHDHSHPELPRVGRPCFFVGWPIERAGRKIALGGSMHDEQGEWLVLTKLIFITLNRALRTKTTPRVRPEAGRRPAVPFRPKTPRRAPPRAYPPGRRSGRPPRRKRAGAAGERAAAGLARGTRKNLARPSGQRQEAADQVHHTLGLGVHFLRGRSRFLGAGALRWVTLSNWVMAWLICSIPWPALARPRRSRR